MPRITHLHNLPSSDIWLNPVENGVLTSGWGQRIGPISGKSENHKGIDIGVPLNTNVVAVKSGEVTKAGYSPSYGNFIGYKTYDGYDVFYAHLNELIAQKGDIVEKGQLMALSGNTGSSTGPHLHYEIEQKGVSVNPLDFVNFNK